MSQSNQNQTGLSTINESPHGLTVYDRVDPMTFIDSIGKVYALTGAGGAKNENEGKLLALACLCKRMDIFQISNEYHLMSGKLTMKADVMLGKFRLAGGKHKWIKDGEDGKEAVLELTFEGQTLTSRFTIDQAKEAGFNFKDGSNWRKDPASMLRARCITRGVKMIAPEIVGGYYTPDEIEDFMPSSEAAATTAVSQETVKQVKSRGKELRDMKEGKTTTAAVATTEPATETTAKDDVVDAVVSPIESAPASTAKTEEVPFDVPTTASADSAPASSKTATLMEIELVITKLGCTKQQVEQLLKSKDANFTTIDSLSEDKAKQLLSQLEGNLAKKQAAQAA